MSVDGEHTILLPSVDSVLDVRFNDIIDAICYVFYLSLAFDIHDLNSPRFKCLSVLLQLGTVRFSLSFQCLLFLSYHLL